MFGLLFASLCYCIIVWSELEKNCKERKKTPVFILQILCSYKLAVYYCTQKYKYPQCHLFLAHIFLYIFLLMNLESNLNFLRKSEMILFISKSTLWIYLWYTLVLKLAGHVIPDVYWSLKCIFVVSTSLLIVFIQNKILDIIKTKWKIPILKVFHS